MVSRAATFATVILSVFGDLDAAEMPASLLTGMIMHLMFHRSFVGLEMVGT
jgi:hypothetical protein